MAITPYLLYDDVGGALKFLAKAFGFRKYGAQMLRPDGKINHAGMMLTNTLSAPGKQALPSSRSLRIRNTAIVVTALKIRKAISGTSRRKFVVQNRKRKPRRRTEEILTP